MILNFIKKKKIITKDKDKIINEEFDHRYIEKDRNFPLNEVKIKLLPTPNPNYTEGIMEISERIQCYVKDNSIFQISIEGRDYDSLDELLSVEPQNAFSVQEYNTLLLDIGKLKIKRAQELSPKKVYEYINPLGDVGFYLFNPGLLCISDRMAILINKKNNQFYIDLVIGFRIEVSVPEVPHFYILSIKDDPEDQLYFEQKILNSEKYSHESKIINFLDYKLKLYNQILLKDYIKFEAGKLILSSSLHFLISEGNFRITPEGITNEQSFDLLTIRRFDNVIKHSSEKIIVMKPPSPMFTYQSYAKIKGLETNELNEILELYGLGFSNPAQELDNTLVTLLNHHFRRKPIKHVKLNKNLNKEDKDISGQLFKGIEEIKEVLGTINKNTSETNKQVNYIVKELNPEIVSLRKLLIDQINSFNGNQEMIEAVLEKFYDQIFNVSKEFTEDQFGALNQEKQALILSSLESLFGDSWSEIDNQTKTFLFTSEFIFGNIKKMDGRVDFSPVVIPLTKALEHELHLHIVNPIEMKCKKDYGNDFTKWPLSLIERNTKGAFRIKRFSLGSVPYILNDSQAISILKEIKAFKDKTFFEYKQLQSFIRDLETVRYLRNEVAHKDGITLDTAEKCRAILIFEKRILVNFIKKTMN